jgi:hypothetical protein
VGRSFAGFALARPLLYAPPMRARRLPRLPVLLVSLLVAACTGSGDVALDPAGGKADDLGPSCTGAALDSKGVCRFPDGRFAPKVCCSMSPLQQLANRLGEPDVVVMPPPGVEFNANELSIEVRVVDVPDPDRPGDVIVPIATQIAAEVNGESSDLLGIFQHADDHFSLSGGFLDAGVRAAFLADIAESERAELTAALDALPAWYGAHLESFDVGSEIVGRDLFVIAPFGGSQALILIVRYTQS